MINAIFACDINNGIGNKNELPWPRNSEDLKWFKEHTSGGTVIMGRKTWESIGSKPLPNRQNIVITKTPTTKAKFVDFENSLSEVLDELQQNYPLLPIWIIGGATIYEQAMYYCENIYMTRFKQTYECDTFIAKDLLVPFQRLKYSRDTDECSFTIWGRS